MAYAQRQGFKIEEVGGLPFGTLVFLNPNWEYDETLNKNKTFLRTQEGQLNVYTLVGSWADFNFPLTFVSSSEVSLINSWWSSNAVVQLTITASDKTVQEKHLCRIANPSEPFPSNMAGRYTDFRGLLNLTTINSEG